MYKVCTANLRICVALVGLAVAGCDDDSSSSNIDADAAMGGAGGDPVGGGAGGDPVGGGGGEPALPSIVEIAVGNPDFETLVVALTAADLVDTLSGPGPFTVFAPTDAAFAALPEGTVAALLADIPTLTDILTYHVIAGEVPAADVVAAVELTMLNGDTAAITLAEGNAYIDGAQIIMTDLQASNGIVHVIDAVMQP